MPTLGVGMMAVPERRQAAAQLLERLALPSEVVAWDRNHLGHVANWWKAVEIASSDDPSHVLIIEDDALPCRDFILAVKLLIDLYPERTISFFTRTKVIAEAPAGTLVQVHDVPTDIAVVYPTPWLRDLRVDYLGHEASFARKRRRWGYGADEMRQELRPDKVVWTTAPSLVQHGGAERSTLGHHYPGNLTARYIGEDVSALSIDWAGAKA